MWYLVLQLQIGVDWHRQDAVILFVDLYKYEQHENMAPILQLRHFIQ